MRQVVANARVAAVACVAVTLAACGVEPPPPTPGGVASPGAARVAQRVASATSTATSAFDAPEVGVPAVVAPTRVAAAAVPAPAPALEARLAPSEDATLPPPPREAPAASRAAAAPDAARRYRVQLGAYARGSTAASLAWEGVVARHAVLVGRTPLIGAARTSQGTSIHRLQVAGLTRGEAQDLCATLVATGDPCFVVPPPHARPR